MIRGLIAPLRQFQVIGWTYQPEDPDRHLVVEFRLSGETIGQVTANRYYDHLAAAGIGKGDHGFVFNTDHHMPLSDPDRLEVVAIDGALEPFKLAFGKPAPVKKEHHEDSAARPSRPAPAPALTFPGPARDRAQRPVFILGSARSGTTAMAQALISSTCYEGHGEGHLLDLLPVLLGGVEATYAARRGEWETGINTMIAAVPQSFMSDAVRHGFVELARVLFPRGFWIEKTPRPEMTRAAPALQQVWPEARFIFMKRRAVENIASRRKKFPTITFEDHCRDWTDSMVAWEAVRGSLAPHAVEIDQMDMACDPAETVKALQPMLSLTEQESRRLTEALALDRPERTASYFGMSQDLLELSWSKGELATFRAICGPVMQRFGYVEGASYRSGLSGMT